jgi:hypothetical protein
MDRHILRVAFFIVSFGLAAVGSANEGVRFDGSIKIEDRPPTTFDLVVGKNQVRTIDLSAGYRLEAAATTHPQSGARTQVRLLKQDGEAQRIVHEALAEVPWGQRTTSSYAVCKGGVSFSSPSTVGMTPACP